ncbi:MAG TPA: GNAT family N-acetyltransferase [Mycobacteriales bacterium]|nr:GNAT family N-acetyltransferase [Mycobacteriales bacterium]
MIDYQVGLSGVRSAELTGFFDGWPMAPSPDALLRILDASALAVLARDDGRVVGFVNALSDGEFAVYIPLLEVRSSHRGRGIGSELVDRVRRHFSTAYMIDAVCDPDVAPFYERLGLTRLAGMAHRNRQAPMLQVTG